MNNPENAVVYARYSSHNQQEQSIEGQLAAARKYADTKGYTIIHEYCDRAKTGTNDNRDEFQKMLSDCSKKKFSVIIVWKVDRFGRNREEITFNKYRAKKHGVRVEYVAENISEGPEGVILESVLEGMAEYFSLQLSQNVKRGLLESAKKHRIISGQIPLGYRAGPDKTFEINPDTAPTVKLIFDMYAAGSTMAEITRYLNDHGYRTSKGKPFTKDTLPRILHNEKYIGIYTYKDIIRDENAVPAIVDRDVFEKVQQMMKVNRKAPSSKWSYSDYILSDKLFCGHCGTPMVGTSGSSHTGAKYGYYACGERLRNKSCHKKNVRQDLIEENVLTDVHYLLQDDAKLDFIADLVWQQYLKDDQHQQEIQMLKKQLAGVEKSIANLVRSIEAGIFNDAIKTRMDELDGEKAALQKAIAENELTTPMQITKEQILFFLYQLRDMDFEDRKCQKRLIAIFVNSIYLYDDDRLVINYNFKGDGSSNTVTLSETDHAISGSEGFACCVHSPAAKTAVSHDTAVFCFSNKPLHKTGLPHYASNA